MQRPFAGLWPDLLAQNDSLQVFKRSMLKLKACGAFAAFGAITIALQSSIGLDGASIRLSQSFNKHGLEQPLPWDCNSKYAASSTA